MDGKKEYELQRKGVRKTRKGNNPGVKKTKASQWERECINKVWDTVTDVLRELKGNG